MNDTPTGADKAAQYPAFPGMSEAERVQLFQEAYTHGLCAMVVGQSFTRRLP